MVWFSFSPCNRYISLHFSHLKFMIAFILLMFSLYMSIFYWSIIDIQYHFQVCIIVIWYLYTFLKWSQQWPVNICHHTNLLQSCWLYSLCCILHLSDLIFFIAQSLSLSIPFTHFSCPHNTLPLEPPFCSLWVCFVCFGFWIPCIWEITWLLSFSVWFISLSIITSRSIHIAATFHSFFLAEWYNTNYIY